MDIPYLPGRVPAANRPLGRFLPPLEEGPVRRLIEREDLAGRTVLDPFGSSPELAIEAAQAGCSVLVAVNNPITRFLLERRLDPLPLDVLQAALAQLAAAEKDDTRLERFMLDLYRTRCLRCGESVTAEYFVWDQEQDSPVLKAYTCPHCNHTGEDPVDEDDQAQADRYRSGLHYALALEELAPVDDPQREHAEAALSAYSGRAIYAIVTLVNKARQLRLDGREAIALQALLLSAFDASDSMWAHPEGRNRPKQLTASPRFREANVWRALERAVDQWAEAGAGVPIRWWPESGPPAVGGVSIFAGPLRQFADTLPLHFDGALITVPPRPNQAYWTLSALWAAWIWGREAAEPIRSALRRRRYDWGWHAAALRRTTTHLVEALPEGTAVHLLIPEAEPGFVGACMAGFDSAGLAIDGRALRLDDAQAQFKWRVEGSISQPSPSLASIPEWIEDYLIERAEPAPYTVLHTLVATNLAADRSLGAWWARLGEPPVSELERRLQAVLADPSLIVRQDQRQDPETGVFWLSNPVDLSESLADRTERVVFRLLRQRSAWAALELDRAVCRELLGLLTPDRALVQACLDSYGVQDEQGRWMLRPEDAVDARQADLTEIRLALAEMGERLDYEVVGQDPIRWRTEDRPVFTFRVMETALLRDNPSEEGAVGLVYVLPGGRSGLIDEKARRDLRLRNRLAAGLIILKFRHIRRLHSDTTLTRENFFERAGIDPPENQDPQLPLL
ncbi:MAG: hypothetical protein WBR18_15355 [Anaerolineales bacterium]